MVMVKSGKLVAQWIYFGQDRKDTFIMRQPTFERQLSEEEQKTQHAISSLIFPPALLIFRLLFRPKGVV
jgi:hypothetical protein